MSHLFLSKYLDLTIVEEVSPQKNEDLNGLGEEGWVKNAVLGLFFEIFFPVERLGERSREHGLVKLSNGCQKMSFLESYSVGEEDFFL